MLKNTASQSVTLWAVDASTGIPKTGDAANMVFYVSKDDGTVTAISASSGVPTECDSTNAKGDYKIALSAAETNAEKLRFSGKSSTSNVVVVPQTIYTLDLGRLGIIDEGTAQSASSTGIVGRSAAIFDDNTLIGNILYVYGSTQGFGQSRSISANTLTGDAYTVDPSWGTTPSGTITYRIFASAPAPSSYVPAVNVTQWKGSTAPNLTGDAYAAAASSYTAANAANLNTIDIKNQTDKLTFTVTGMIDANVLDWKSSTAPSFPANFSSLAITAGGIVQSDLQTIKTQTVTCSGGVTFPTGTLASGGNVPTAAAIATAVWQDSTAGDFTTANSIGKSLYNSFTANTSVFTSAALVNAGGSAPTAAQIATAVWQDSTSSDFTASSSIGKSLYNAFVSNTSVFTVGALANAPTGSGASVSAIAAAVWQDVTAGDFTVANSIGKSLYNAFNANSSALTTTALGAVYDIVNSGTIGNAALMTACTTIDTHTLAVKTKTDQLTFGATNKVDINLSTAPTDWISAASVSSGAVSKIQAGLSVADPLSSSVPGSYTSGTAGYVLGQIGTNRTIAMVAPTVDSSGSFSLIRGDDYYATESQNVSFTYGSVPNLTSATVVMRIQTGSTYVTVNGTISGAGTSTQIVNFEFTKTVTASLMQGTHEYQIIATLSNGHVLTMPSGKGTISMKSRVE